MQLRSIFKGIYSLDGFNPDNQQTPLILVHALQHDPPKDVQAHDKYCKKLRSHVANHPGPLISLEEWPFLQELADFYRMLGRIKDSYYIKTRTMTSDPKEIGWERIAEFAAIFPKRPVLIGGGYIAPEVFRYLQTGVWEKPINQIFGCLSYVVYKLSKEAGVDVKIITELTYQ